MAYIDSVYYKDSFDGSPVPEDQFPRLASIASDLIDMVVSAPIVVSDLGTEVQELLKKATAYQVECLYSQGGIDAINGLSESSISSESLGSYSITKQTRYAEGQKTNQSMSVGGIPFSALAYSLLKRAGLINKWVYKGTRLDNG